MINWGIVSTGNIAHSFVEDFRFTQGGNILAVASRSVSKAKKFSEKFHIRRYYGSYEELFHDKEVDVVYIATPHNLHLRNTSDALMNGKAVLCEKPITVHPSECQKLIDLSQKTRNYLMEAMWTYFLPPVQQARKWIDDGKIGSIRQLEADFGFKADYDPKGRLYNPELAGGALLDIGIYPVALAWLIFNVLPRKISATAEMADTGVDETVTMKFEYTHGATADLRATLQRKLENDALITGTRGYIRIPEFFMARECFLYSDGKLMEHFTDNRKSVGYNYEIEAVNRDLLEGKLQSDIVPLSASMNIQEMMAKITATYN